MARGGLQDIAVVDLSAGTVTREPVTRQLALNYIGGQGIGSYLLYRHVKPGTDPLSPQNALILAPGSLTGTSVPSASRSTFMAKSPTDGCYLGMSNGGSMIQLRQAGFDLLLILGKAPHPVYLDITDKQINIRDARPLWGLDTFETTEALWSELGPHHDVAAIGPAGENLVRCACIIGNKHVAWGRTGLGAVMGSKNLKAITAYGSRGTYAEYPVKLLGLSKRTARELVADEESIDLWRDGGTWKWLWDTEKPARNPESDLWDLDRYDSKLLHRPEACPGCPVGCKHALKIAPGYKYEGLELVVGCTYATMNGPFGLGLGLQNMEDMMKCGEWVQRLGMDSEVTAGVISMLIEMHQNGVVGEEYTDGLELGWGDPELAFTLMKKIAHRQGVGDWLAEGVAPMVRSLGEAAEPYRVSFKGMGRALNAHAGGDMRLGVSTPLFAWSVNYRGHGDRHRYPSMGGRPDQKKGNVETVLEKAVHLGISLHEVDRLGEADEEIVPGAMRHIQAYNTVAYALGFCDRAVVLNALPIERMTEFYNEATGLGVTGEDLIEAGRRVWNLEKVWVTMQGQTKTDDYPPSRFFEETVEFMRPGRPPVEYPSFPRRTYEKMLTHYYRSHEWDPDTGLPTPELLSRLGLDWVIDDYRSYLAGSGPAQPAPAQSTPAQSTPAESSKAEAAPAPHPAPASDSRPELLCR